jgi:single-strand DNA-binding protein
MAGSINRAILLGNLTRDPEIRNTADGAKIATFSVATSERWKDKTTGERKERPEFHRVVIFNEKLAEIAEQFLKKGRKVYLEGQIQTRKWTDQTGIEKYTTEIVLSRFRGELVLLDGRNDAQETAFEMGESSGSRDSTSSAKEEPFKDFDDEIPF